MSVRTLDRLIAAGLFVFALVLYLLTVAPTVSFWDPGERIAVSHGLQIPHPPGAPLYMLIGRMFSMFAPTGLVAIAVNMISVLSSATTVLLTYLIVVRLVAEWRGPREAWTTPVRISAMGGGIIAALTLAVSDSFWFDAVEAETYALSATFTAMSVWLTLKWAERQRLQQATLAAGQTVAFGGKTERWLLLIAYLYGLASGVHLLSLLSIFFAALIVYFERFERPEWDMRQRLVGLLAAAGISSAVFLMIYPGIIRILPNLARASGSLPLFLTLLAALLIFGIYYTQKKKLRTANLLVMVATLVVIGYSSYGIIIIRSAANPPIDQNDPQTLDAFISYMNRDQYGSTPLLSGPSYDDRTGNIDEGRAVTFPRRHSSMPQHLSVYARYNSDLHFFISYQVNYMYLRYLLWNFAGREGDHQGANWTLGFTGEPSEHAIAQSPSERASRNVYYGLPLLLGVFGFAFHFMRDWRRAFALLVLFFMTGLGVLLYLNQTPLQPRERDYSYIGSFFAFSLWVGIGAAGLIELATGAFRDRVERIRLTAGGVAFGLLLVAVPGVMIVQNYPSHDRSGQYLPRDFALNMLESTAPNAILFTNGDNDTFPLWYLQEVEGIRRDVRVVNLSLLNTTWYIRQLRDQWSRDSAPLPIRWDDARLDAVRATAVQARDVQLPAAGLHTELLSTIGDTTGIGPVQWRLEGRPFSEDLSVLYVSDQAVLEILSANAENGWERPIYFATTIARDSELGLQPYFQFEGLARRVVPVRTASPDGRMVPDLVMDRLGRFQFTNLNDASVYYDQNMRQMGDLYRVAFAQAAGGLAAGGHRDEAAMLLNRIRTEVPYDVIPLDFFSAYSITLAYEALEDREGALTTVSAIEDYVLTEVATSLRARGTAGQRQLDRALQLAGFVRGTYLRLDAFEQAASFVNRYAATVNDPDRVTPEELQELSQRMRQQEALSRSNEG
ncbi:DUF2723 domain-containing protein [soil metagenome]